MVRYHDEEWGVPSRDPRYLFEMLTLEGAQSGLSWETVLNKREGYRRNFLDFDAERVAAMGPEDVERILQDPGVIRHRGKLTSVLDNARAMLALDQPLDELLWSFAPNPGRPPLRTMADYDSKTPESAAMSKALVKRGFRFVGPTTCYAFMQAVGMVNDHTVDCYRHQTCEELLRNR
jgi:DNA-3-methyladenine glycosylase I